MIRTPPSLNIEPALEEKWQALVANLDSLGSAVVAFSGGVDSSLLAVVAHLVLAPRMLAVTIRSQVETVGLMETASALAQQFGFPHQFVDFNKLENEAYVENSPNRCYVCKSTDLTIITEIAQKAGIQHVLLGANADDMSDYRPGLRAAAELSVLSPLAEAHLNKREIRILAHQLGLGNWNHPSSPCLASRIPYGTQVTYEKLEQVAQGEAYLHALNFEIVRVRNTGPTAKIEVLPGEIERLIHMRELVSGYFKQIGFKYVTVDLEGYRTGSLNEVLAPADVQKSVNA
jgi:pyridinium-3,5-biscarboxylic acid mononucleotide sulfurtransferase